VNVNGHRGRTLVNNLAKRAATLDRISGGRFILGIGAGWQVNEHRAYGFELPPPKERVDRFAELMRGIDVVLTPTQPIVAPPVGIGDLELRGQLTKFTYPFSATGAPALAVPCGEAEDGLPASIQVIGLPGMDALVLGVGALLESHSSPG